MLGLGKSTDSLANEILFSNTELCDCTYPQKNRQLVPTVKFCKVRYSENFGRPFWRRLSVL